MLFSFCSKNVLNKICFDADTEVLELGLYLR